ncbi:hypothetical protein NEUTE1DRAFT_148468, partial [Neurospora tetrasperma FGSC 2508]
PSTTTRSWLQPSLRSSRTRNRWKCLKWWSSGLANRRSHDCQLINFHHRLRAALPNRQPSERRSDFLCRCDCANPRIIPHQANLHQSYLVPAHPRRILFLTAPGLPPVQAQRDSL